MKPIKQTLLAMLTLPLLAPLGASADEVKIVVQRTGGEPAYEALLSQIGSMRFVEGAVTFASGEETLATIDLASIERITFVTTPTGIISTQSAAPLTLRTSQERLWLEGSGADAQQSLQVYAANGALIMQRTVRGTEGLDVSQLPAGVYVLRAGTSTFKFGR